MCNWSSVLVEEGIEEGIERGIEEGIERGENRLGDLISKLISAGRMEDVKQASADEGRRRELYREYGITK